MLRRAASGGADGARARGLVRGARERAAPPRAAREARARGMRIAEPRVDEWARFRDLRLRALRGDPAAFGAWLDDEEKLEEADWRGRILQPGTARFVVEEED